MNEAIIFFSSMLPITELRGAIPLGIAGLKMDPILTFFLAVVGNLIPMFFIMWLMPYIEEWFRKISLLTAILDAIFKRTRDKFGPKYEKYGKVALWIFVGIPLPITGVWTGTLAAWLFGISKKTTYIYVSLGAVSSGIIVTLITLGIIHGF